MKKYIFKVLFLGILIFTTGCANEKKDVINIGYIGPLSLRATDLGVGPAMSMQLAVEEYNLNKQEDEPTINLFIEDDQWDKENALPLYKKLKRTHNMDVLFISNTDGTVAIQDELIKDNVLCINPTNSDDLLSSLNRNTFKIAKKTEEANGLVAIRIIELNLKKVLIIHYPNDFMTRASNTVHDMLKEEGIESKIVRAEIGKTDFRTELESFKKEGYDAYCFFGYKEFGYAMKQARDLNIKAPFFGSTTVMPPEFYNNSEGTIIGTEFPFFTPADGNYVLAYEFLKKYKNKYNEEPFSVWPAMQAYDAINLVINEIRHVNDDEKGKEDFGDWLRKRLYRVRYYQGVCGNLSITEDGSSRGIYFSLYTYESKGKASKIKR